MSDNMDTFQYRYEETDPLGGFCLLRYQHKNDVSVSHNLDKEIVTQRFFHSWVTQDNHLRIPRPLSKAVAE